MKLATSCRTIRFKTSAKRATTLERHAAEPTRNEDVERICPGAAEQESSEGGGWEASTDQP
jgi:hypothetical protein